MIDTGRGLSACFLLVLLVSVGCGPTVDMPYALFHFQA